MAVQTQAQARASLLDQLDNIGASRAEYDTADVFTAAENDVAEFITRVKDNIQRADMIVTGDIDDINVRVTEDSIQVIGQEYLLYQDKGVKGSVSSAKAPNSPYKYTDKMPPLQVFIDYIKRKNLNNTNESSYTLKPHHKGYKPGVSKPAPELTPEEEIEERAYRMQAAVFLKGFKPRNIFAKEIPALREALKISIKGFAADAIKEVFKQKGK